MAPLISPEREQARREQILDAAQRCFVRAGFAATRIDDIAAEAGIGKGTVYLYWSSKEELLADTCLWTCRCNEARMAELLGGAVNEAEEGPRLTAPSGLHPVAAAHRVLHAALAVVLMTTREERQLMTNLDIVALTHPEITQRTKPMLQAKLRGWIAQALALYEAGLAAGHFRRLHTPEDAARIIVAAVEGLVQHQDWLDEDPSDLARRTADAWIRLQMNEPERLEEYLT